MGSGLEGNSRYGWNAPISKHVQGKHQEMGDGNIRKWVRRHHTYIYIYIYIYIHAVNYTRRFIAVMRFWPPGAPSEAMLGHHAWDWARLLDDIGAPWARLLDNIGAPCARLHIYNHIYCTHRLHRLHMLLHMVHMMFRILSNIMHILHMFLPYIYIYVCIYIYIYIYIYITCLFHTLLQMLLHILHIDFMYYHVYCICHYVCRLYYYIYYMCCFIRYHILHRLHIWFHILSHIMHVFQIIVLLL
jgi:hypothetical protein